MTKPTDEECERCHGTGQISRLIPNTSTSKNPTETTGGGYIGQCPDCGGTGKPTDGLSGAAGENPSPVASPGSGPAESVEGDTWEKARRRDLADESVEGEAGGEAVERAERERDKLEADRDKLEALAAGQAATLERIREWAEKNNRYTEQPGPLGEAHGRKASARELLSLLNPKGSEHGD